MYQSCLKGPNSFDQEAAFSGPCTIGASFLDAAALATFFFFFFLLLFNNQFSYCLFFFSVEAVFISHTFQNLTLRSKAHILLT